MALAHDRADSGSIASVHKSPADKIARIKVERGPARALTTVSRPHPEDTRNSPELVLHSRRQLIFQSHAIAAQAK